MKNILVVTNGNIGDFVLATSALKLLRAELPYANITLITSRKIRDLIPKHTLTDEIIWTDFSFTRGFLRQRADQIIWFIRRYFKIKKAKFDDCIFLDHSRFFARAIPLIGIKNLIGPETWWCGSNISNPNIKFLTKAVQLPKDSDNNHMMERYQTIIRSYLGSCNLSMPVLPETMKNTNDKVAKLLNKTKKYSITFSLRGDDIEGNKRIYPIMHAVEIIKNLSSKISADFYILGTKVAYDEAERIKKETADSALVSNLCGQTSLMELKSVFEQTDLLISVDTGTIHIAATTKTNIIGLYGPAKPAHSAPVSSKAVILYANEDCSPCHYKRTVLGTPCAYGDNPKCLLDITPDMVVEAALKVLK